MAAPGIRPEPDLPREISVIRFGLYELRPSTSELRKAGVRVKLQDQPARILLALIQRRGEVVSREQLRGELWPSDTFVEFDAGLNTGVMKLRQALMDTAESPRYIETVPRQGYRFIAPVEIEYDGESEAATVPTPIPVVAPPAPAPFRISWKLGVATGGALLLAGVGIFIAARIKPESASAPPIRFQVDLPAGYQLARGAGRLILITPLGDEIVFLVRKNGMRQLFRRKLSDFESRIIPGTENAAFPSISDDGKWLAFIADGKLKAVSLDGREYREILEVKDPNSHSMVWSSKGMFFGRSVHELRHTLPVPIFHLPPGAQQPVRLTEAVMGRGAETQFVHQLLPGGDRLLFSANTSPVDRSIMVLSLKDRSIKAVVEPGMGGKYLTTGHLVWFWAGSLLAAPFDLDRLEVRGAPVPLLSGVDRDGWRGGNAAISDSGTLAYVPGQAYEPKALMAVDMEGRERTILPMGPYRPLDVSPDGTKLLVSKHDSGGLDWSLWTYDMSSGVWARVLDGSGGTSNAVWGPDGSVIASTDRHGGRFANLYKVSVANKEERRLTRNEAFGQFPQSWSAAANAVLFSEGVHPDTNLDIYALPLSGNAKPVPLVNSAGCETNPVFSPDGKWLAYSYRDAPDASVRIRPYPANTAEIALETGSAGPIWSRDGREIYYRLGQAMMAVPFHSGRLGQPRKLFEGPYAGPEYWNINAVLTPDGKQFLLLKYSEDMPANRRLHVVVNWSTELKRVGNSR